MKIAFRYDNGVAAIFLSPETKRDEQHIDLIKGCEDKASIVGSPNKELSILFKERKLET